MICSKVLRSGKCCKNKAKYANYCGVHRNKDEWFPLFELPEGIIDKIVQCVSSPDDLRNVALASPSLQLFVACHIEKMIKYELPHVNLFYFDFDLAASRINYNRIRALEEKKWNYIFFLAIGGLYIDFKIAGNKFHFSNKVITINISKYWKMFTQKRLILLGKKHPCCFPSDGLIFCINIKEITVTTSYNTTFETTDFDKMEQFFWNQVINH